jgi:hypothetical protein
MFRTPALLLFRHESPNLFDLLQLSYFQPLGSIGALTAVDKLLRTKLVRGLQQE